MSNPTDSTKKEEKQKVKHLAKRFFSQNDLSTREVNIDFVLKGLPRGDIGTIFGNGGVGKGYFIQHLLTNKDNFLYEKPIKICYLTFEDPVDVFAIRYKNQKKISINDCHQFDLLEAIGLELFTVGTTKEKGINHGLFNEIFEHAAYDLLILDTWAMASWQFEENSNSDLTQAMFLLKKVARKHNCSFMLVHHTNKSALNADNSTNEGALRGASSIIGNSRLVVSIMPSKIPDGKDIANMDKVNFVKPERQTFKRTAYGILQIVPNEQTDDEKKSSFL